jgi:hypothetical protein
MLSAVWVAVVIAAAAATVGVGVAVYVMLKAARLVTESSAALASLREREDLVVERASAVIDRAGAQIAKTETVSASMAGVTASMAGLTASVAELRGRTRVPPAALAGADRTGGTLTWVAALGYGLARALALRLAARTGRGGALP